MSFRHSFFLSYIPPAHLKHALTVGLIIINLLATPTLREDLINEHDKLRSTFCSKSHFPLGLFYGFLYIWILKVTEKEDRTDYLGVI